jgi:germination protein M
MKKKVIGFLVLAAILLIAAAIVIIVNLKLDSEKSKTKMNLYFFSEQKTAIVPEEREIEYDEESELIRILVKELVDGPTDKRLQRVVSQKTRLLRLDNSSPDIKLDFSEEYLSGDAAQDVLAAYAVVKTLCGINHVHSVKITVRGQDILSSDGTAIDALSDSDINIASENTEALSREVILYFSTKDFTSLVKEVHTVKISDKQPVEQYIVGELIAGPVNKDFQPVLSQDTPLISAETRDGVCYVNFKQGFVDRNTGSAQKERIAIYSIVNSLTELDNVQQVQFLIDGKKVDKFGNMSISELFAKNATIVAHK